MIKERISISGDLKSKVKQLMEYAGWQEGRKVDISIAEQYYADHGVPMMKTTQRFYRKYFGLCCQWYLAQKKLNWAADFQFALFPYLVNGIKNQHGFLLFDNAYSCHSHTVPVLTYALTAKNQYNTLPLEQAASIIEIAQAADFHTVWISNQVKYGAWDTPVSVIADQSQTQYWLNGHLGETTQTTHFDLSLVDVLKKLPVFDKALIVVHLMGNHGSYEESYPHAFNRWTGKSHIDKYDNSILYNDFVMKQLFSAVKDLPNFQGLIYFSDHADDVDAGLGHDASRFTFDMARIPLYMYFSDNYIQKYPHTMAILKKHTSAYFTNDLIFDTLINIMQIPFPVLEETNSLADKNYKNTSTNLKTLYGKKSLSEDPFAD